MNGRRIDAFDRDLAALARIAGGGVLVGPVRYEGAELTVSTQVAERLAVFGSLMSNKSQVVAKGGFGAGGVLGAGLVGDREVGGTELLQGGRGRRLRGAGQGVVGSLLARAAADQRRRHCHSGHQP